MAGGASAPSNTFTQTQATVDPFRRGLLMGTDAHPGPLPRMQWGMERYLNTMDSFLSSPKWQPKGKNEQGQKINKWGETQEQWRNRAIAENALTGVGSAAGDISGYTSKFDPRTGRMIAGLNPDYKGMTQLNLDPTTGKYSAPEAMAPRKAAKGGIMGLAKGGKTPTPKQQAKIAAQLPPDMLLGKTAGVGKDPVTGLPMISNPDILAAQQQTRLLQTPGQFQQGTEAYQQGIAGLRDVAKYQPSQVGVQNINAPTVQSAGNISPERVTAQQLGFERVNSGQGVNAQNVSAQQISNPAAGGPTTFKEQTVQNQKLNNYQMAGPGSWTDTGTASKYMDPYIQNVLNIAKRESNRDYGKQLQQLNAGAAAAGAYGGSRHAIERSEAARNQMQRLSDIETQGLSQAYNQGMGQFTTEEQMRQGAAVQNLQALLGVQGLSSSQYLQAALANQQANLAAQQYGEQSKQFGQGLGLQAQTANQQAALQAALANQAANLQAGQFNSQQALQAMLANQAAGIQTGQANQQAALQAMLANQAAGMQAGQFNIGQANQMALANQQYGYQAQAANQNAAMQAALANQQAGLNAAGLQANAYTNMGNMAQGLGALGTAQQNADLARIAALAQSGQYTNNLMQQYYNTNQQNAMNAINAPMQLGTQMANTINGVPTANVNTNTSSGWG